MTVSIEVDGRAFVRSSDCLVVANPAAAGVDAAVVRAVEARLARAARTVRTVWTATAGRTAELVGAHVGLVVVVGGDGTVVDLVQSLSPGGRTVVCALPVGSGNSTARNLWGELTWHEILDLLAQPSAVRLREIDLLRLVEPGITAVLGTSTGFLAQVLVGARTVDPGVTGIDRYYAAAGAVLQAMPAHPTTVTVDGTVLAGGPLSSVAVGGGRFRARSFQFLPESLLDDGLLDVSTIDAIQGSAVGDLLALMPSGAHLGRPEVRYARGQRVVIERTDGRPLVAEFDGTVWDGAGCRLTVEIVPRGLTVLTAAACG